MFKDTIKKKQKKIRKKIALHSGHRLTVYKSNKHVYAQLYNSNGTDIITSASTIDKSFKEAIKDHIKLNKKDAASLVGDLLAKKIAQKNITHVIFDRSGFKFHGRIKAVADSIKNFGINC